MIKDVNISSNTPVKITIGGTVSQSNVQVPDEYLTESEGNAAYQPIGEAVFTWSDYAMGYSSDPVSLGNVSDGEVFEYTYTNGTLYRLVPSGSAVDSFYTTFDGTTLSGLLVQKPILL